MFTYPYSCGQWHLPQPGQFDPLKTRAGANHGHTKAELPAVTRVRRLRSPGTFVEPAPEPEAKEPAPA